MEMILEEKAALCLEKIAECLTLSDNKLTTFGYANGLLGKSLFFSYYAAFTENLTYNDWASKTLTASINKLTEPYEGKSFYKELSELGIFLEYARANNILNVETNQILSGIDKIMEKMLEKAMDEKDFDPYTGALMYGSYFLGRSKSKPLLIPMLEKITIWLGKISKKDHQGNVFWVSKLFDKNNIYLGISHGLAAIMIYLCRVYEMGIQREMVKEMLINTSKYILKNELDFSTSGYHFPNIVNEENGRTTLGLCYGDMGVGYSLLRAGILLKNEKITNKALSIFHNCATRKEFSEAGIRDAGILYGASGVALMFDKVYEMTRIREFYDVATDWYEKIIDFSNNENLTAGFEGHFNQHFKHTNIAFMEGMVGIGCTLIKYSDRENYSFDELIWLN